MRGRTVLLAAAAVGVGYALWKLPVTQRFVSTFDTALAPVIATLDGLPGYVDPWLAPTDFLDWLAGWVGVEVDEEWTVPQRRQIGRASCRERV